MLTGAIFLAAALGFLCYMLCAQILTDDTRLYWLGLRGWRSVLWEEITDYYEERLPKSGSLASIIETPIHRFMLTEASWTNVPALRRCVQLRATRARATNWGERKVYT